MEKKIHIYIWKGLIESVTSNDPEGVEVQITEVDTDLDDDLLTRVTEETELFSEACTEPQPYTHVFKEA